MTITPKRGDQGRRGGTKSTRRRAIAVGTATAISICFLLGEGAASAATPRSGSTQILHYYSVSKGEIFSNGAGMQFSPSKSDPPRSGDQIEGTDLDYVGNHSSHAKNWTASDHELCIFNSANIPVCHAQVAIGNSMILAEATLTNLSASTTTTKYVITGGTGEFQGATGLIVAMNINESRTSNSDVTITWHRS
jgi:hypothetical protein